MDNDKIKSMLMDIQNTELDFSVTMTGKESKKVNGLYKPDTHEILLHNKNFKSDNQLIYTAIHEYTHHLITEESEKLGALAKPNSAKVHNTEFWAKFHSLLEIAEQKGIYVIGLENAPELEKLTEDIRKNYIEPNGKLMTELGKQLIKAHELCEAANIRYEDYIDRVLRLPRNAAHSIAQVAAAPVNPAIGFENMKLVAALKKPEERFAAEKDFMDGKSPDSVRALMKKKADEVDPKSKLEKEKKRLEKTINELNHRLELVEESLAQM